MGHEGGGEDADRVEQVWKEVPGGDMGDRAKTRAREGNEGEG